MKKRLFCMFLALIMSFSLGTMALADNTANMFIPPETMTGTITADDGKQISITGTLVNMARPMSVTSNEISATYKYLVPDASVIFSGDHTMTGQDTGQSSIVYLTISYKYTQGLPTMYLLTSVSGYWAMTDAKASVESASVTYGCSHLADIPQTGSANVSNYFDISTGFDTYIYEELGVMGCTLTVNYIMGSSRRWSTTFTNNLFNNP